MWYDKKYFWILEFASPSSPSPSETGSNRHWNWKIMLKPHASKFLSHKHIFQLFFIDMHQFSSNFLF